MHLQSFIYILFHHRYAYCGKACASDLNGVGVGVGISTFLSFPSLKETSCSWCACAPSYGVPAHRRIVLSPQCYEFFSWHVLIPCRDYLTVSICFPVAQLFKNDLLIYN